MSLPFTLSFEFFPPKTAEMETVLWNTVDRIKQLSPEFVSVTYGAGGTTQEKTLSTLSHLSKNYADIPAAGHLTCVGKSKNDIDDVARAFLTSGINHIVALRGDAPAGQDHYTPHPEGYEGVPELITGLKKVGNFKYSVAVYPERHPDSLSFEADIDHLKRKIDAGADQGITQFFFDNDAYLRFMERVQKAGITIPILAGILPILNYQTTQSFAKKCGTHLPERFEHLFSGTENDASVRQMIAAHLAFEQCKDLQTRGGLNHFHFYTLNRFELTLAVTKLLANQQ